MDSFTSFLATNKFLFTSISFAISLPSTLLYCAEIWTIFWHKPFHNSFYTLFYVRASTDLVYTLNNYFGNNIPNMFPEWFMRLELSNWFPTIVCFLSSYTFCSDNLTMGLILLNRFTAIVKPITHEQIWRKFMPAVLLIVFGVPLYSVGMFGINVEFEVVRDDRGRIMSIFFSEANKGTTLNTYVGISTIFSVLFLAFCIPINLAILWAYRKRRQQLKLQLSTGNTAAKAKADRIERRLLIFAVFTFLGHILIAIMLMTLYLAMMAGNLFLTTLLVSQYGLIMDFGLVVLPSWLLLWASPSFRRKLMVTFLPNVLHNKIFGTTHTNNMKKAQTATALKINVAIVKPVQISPLSK